MSTPQKKLADLKVNEKYLIIKTQDIETKYGNCPKLQILMDEQPAELFISKKFNELVKDQIFTNKLKEKKAFLKVLEKKPKILYNLILD